MILLWGILEDGPLACVHEVLERRRTPFVLLDQYQLLDTQIESRYNGSIHGYLRVNEQRVELSQVTAVYVRCWDWRRLPALQEAGEQSAAWMHAVALEQALLTWLEVTPTLVVNRLSAMASNGSKPYQASLINALGFKVPETLVTTSPDAVIDFYRQYGTLIYKSVSGVRSIIAKLTRDKFDRLEAIRWCPTQFQEYIPGTDYRVHVIGDETFCVQILSQADDYRYASRQGFDVEMRPVELPDELLARCARLTKGLGLVVSGVDLRRTPDGEWYCFEVNPSPGFSYYEKRTGLPMAEAMARVLTDTKKNQTRVST